MFLVIGLGSMGKRRIRNLRANQEGDIIGFDISADRCKEVSEAYEIRTFSNIEEAFKQGDLKGVIISTPPNLHTKYALMAAERAVPFFTEAGTTTEGMEELITVVEKNNSVAAPSCTMRFQPSIKLIKKLLDQGRVGEILSFSHHCGQYLPDWHPWEDYRKFYVSKKETGACREIVPFELTWLCHLFGIPTEVSCFRSKLLNLDCDIDDIYQLLLNFSNKMLSHLQVDVISRVPIRALRILGTTGNIEWNMMEKKVRVYTSSDKKWEDIEEPTSLIVEGYSEMSNENMYIEEIGAFLSAARKQSVYPHTLQEEKAILNILFKAEESAQQNTHKII